jgi:hypothetical protein
VWIGFIWLRIVLTVGSFEHGNEPWCSIKDEFIGQVSDFQSLKNDPALWSYLNWTGI